MASLNDTPTIQTLKALTAGTTLFIAGSLASTTLQSIPALVLATQQKDSSSSRPKLGSRQETSGRLTPQPGKQVHLDPLAALAGKLDESVKQAGAGGEGYKVAAMQFTLMSKSAFRTLVPGELLSIIASGYLAYHYRSLSLPSLTTSSFLPVWQKYALVSALVTAVFPFTVLAMAPVELKLARLAGEEPPIETFEDALPDREMERGNAEEFLLKWNGLNAIRSGLLVLAGGVGLWGLV